MRKTILAAALWLYGTALFDSTAGADMVVQACFSPQGKCAAHILREIESAKKELLVAVYAFTSDDLASALVQAKKRGVAVQVGRDVDRPRQDAVDGAARQGHGEAVPRPGTPRARIARAHADDREARPRGEINDAELQLPPRPARAVGGDDQMPARFAVQ